MTSKAAHDAWSVGQNYEHYMGRWSRKISIGFLNWIEPPTDADWLEIGCGTGALTSSVLQRCAPKSILATDASPDFLGHARDKIDDPCVTFKAADAQELPLGDATVDVVTSALVLNFIPDKTAALYEMQRVLRPGGMLTFYVWDYPGGGMGFIDAFWNAAAAVDPEATKLNEADRFGFCTEQGVRALCADAGLQGVEISAIDIVTEFADFEAFWKPFTMGAGPAPGYCASLSADRRGALKSRLQADVGAGGPVALSARAWAVKARVQG